MSLGLKSEPFSDMEWWGKMKQLMSAEFWGNPAWAWAMAGLAAAAGFLALFLLRVLLARRLKHLAEKTRTELDDFLADLVGRTKILFLLVLSIFGGSQLVSLSERVGRIVDAAAILALLLQAGLWGSAIVSYWIPRWMTRNGQKAPQSSAVGIVRFVGKMAVWSLALIIALDNFGVDITALVAGLGVGGVAVALAVQNILGDVFAAVSIALDKPFEVGDFIIVDDLMGTVEYIGVKTTRVRSLSGEQIVLCNSDLLKSRVRNFKRMYERRVVFTVGVTYQTPLEKLERIPSLIREIIEAQPDLRFDRAHLTRFGDSSLLFEVVYYVESPDFNLHMDRQQAIHLGVMHRFAGEGIEFAYPTQTLHIVRS